MISRPKSNKTNIFLKKSIQPNNKEIINAIQNKGNAYFPNFNDGLYKYINEKNQSIKVEPLNVKITSKLINFFDFLLYLGKYKRGNQVFYILNQFRQKLLGEEHIFRTNIIMYHLEKYFDVKEIKNVDIMELYDNL